MIAKYLPDFVVELAHDIRHYSLTTALLNARFNFAYWLGGFTHADNFEADEDPNDASTWLTREQRRNNLYSNPRPL